MPKPFNPGYKPGDYWLICDRTGMAHRVSDMRREWTGHIVHKDEWEPRHPQDFIRGVVDDPSVKGPTRTEPTEEFVADATPENPSARAGVAIAGYAISGHTAYAQIAVPTGTFDNSL